VSRRTSVALFTADLRVTDNPVLRAAQQGADQVVPLFVLDSGVADSGFLVPNRAAFLAGCLADLDAALRRRGGRLVVRRGDVVTETCRVVAETGATEVHVAAGVSRYATRREQRLVAALEDARCAVRAHDAVVTVVPPGAVVPSAGAGRDHFAVFTPYFRRWSAERRRDVVATPRRLTVPDVASEPVPAARELTELTEGVVSPALPAGGEDAGRRAMRRWLAGPVDEYDERHDDLAGDDTSRLSPYLHFGCLSPVELARAATGRGGAGAEAFVRQLAWRDFHHQVLAARPEAAHEDYRPHGDTWRTDADEVAAWREGRTGYPIVDAAMRQLRHEGWMHNRARLLTASFLAKTLYVDWRVGARHFLDLLVDGDVANNQLNWQWVAGTGTDTRPNRVLNPLTQARRFDPRGAYVRRWVPELADVTGAAVHQPWRLPRAERDHLDYPDPIVDLAAGQERFRRARGKA
jgi:deoxyribodipyrimidine photo-lyase